MPGVPTSLAFSGFNTNNVGFAFGLGRLSLDITPFAILTAGSGVNVQVAALALPPLPFPMPNYVLESTEFAATVAAGTIVAATFDLKVNAVSLLTAPIALVGLTGANIRLLTAGPATAAVQLPSTVPAALSLILSQTVNSANAATLTGRVHLMLLPS